MAKEPTIYRQLPGRGASAIHYTQLYLAPDHLLQVASTGYSESYKRFYFRDIQAITLRPSVAGKIWNAIWASIAVILAVNALAVSGTAQLVLFIIAGFFAVVLLANIAIGPTCACAIRTAVQTERLPSLKRLRQTRKVINQLKPLIAAAQGALSPDELALRLDEANRRATYEADAPPVIHESTPVTPDPGPPPS